MMMTTRITIATKFSLTPFTVLDSSAYHQKLGRSNKKRIKKIKKANT